MNSVPDLLIDWLEEAYHKFCIDHEACEYALSFQVIKYYLGDEWAHSKVRLNDIPDDFMLNDKDEASENRWIHQHRVIELGDALFNLRNATNSEALFQRFQTRKTRSCFLECVAANIVVSAGLSVEIVRESGKRGGDFDFIGLKPGVRINVEVTAKEGDELTDNTIQNTLSEKRNQVPANQPALLFISVPEQWTKNRERMERITSRAVESFFRRSKRYNAVIFIWDATVKVETSRAIALIQKSYIHPSPRHIVQDLSWLQPRHPLSDLSVLQELAISAPDHLRTELGSPKSKSHVLEWLVDRVVS